MTPKVWICALWSWQDFEAILQPAHTSYRVENIKSGDLCCLLNLFLLRINPPCVVPIFYVIVDGAFETLVEAPLSSTILIPITKKNLTNNIKVLKSTHD